MTIRSIREVPDRRKSVSTSGTSRASRVRVEESAVVKIRLSLTVRLARGVALVLLILQLLAMLAPAFHPVATFMAGKDAVAYTVAVVLAVVVAAGCVWAGVQVWQDAGDRDIKKARL